MEPTVDVHSDLPWRSRQEWGWLAPPTPITYPNPNREQKQGNTIKTLTESKSGQHIERGEEQPHLPVYQRSQLWESHTRDLSRKNPTPRTPNNRFET